MMFFYFTQYHKVVPGIFNLSTKEIQRAKKIRLCLTNSALQARIFSSSFCGLSDFPSKRTLVEEKEEEEKAAALTATNHCGSAGKQSAHNVGDLGSIPGVGRSPEEGKGYPLQYSGLENFMDYTVTELYMTENFHFLNDGIPNSNWAHSCPDYKLYSPTSLSSSCSHFDHRSPE